MADPTTLTVEERALSALRLLRILDATEAKLKAVEAERDQWKARAEAAETAVKYAAAEREQQIAQLGAWLKALSVSGAEFDDNGNPCDQFACCRQTATEVLAKGRALGLPWGEGE